MNPFFLKNTIIGPLELRPWTMTTQLATEQLELAKLSEQEQIMACAWVQSREPEEVEQASSDGSAQLEIRNFIRWFPLALYKPLGEWCRAQIECVDSGKVDVLPQPGGRTDQPKN
jgi:hypothetical protein